MIAASTLNLRRLLHFSHARLLAPIMSQHIKLWPPKVLPSTGVTSTSFQVFVNKVTSYIPQDEMNCYFVSIPGKDPGLYSTWSSFQSGKRIKARNISCGFNRGRGWNNRRGSRGNFPRGRDFSGIPRINDRDPYQICDYCFYLCQVFLEHGFQIVGTIPCH